MDFVGITYDLDGMEARLPMDKVHKCNSLIQNFKSRNSCKRKEMESLISYWASRVL